MGTEDQAEVPGNQRRQHGKQTDECGRAASGLRNCCHSANHRKDRGIRRDGQEFPLVVA
jgi:hypothetical protein